MNRLHCHGFLRALSFIALISCSLENIIIHYENSLNEDHTNISHSQCITLECVTASYILESINSSVDPCTDFYEFACGKWIENHPVPMSQSNQNQFLIVEDKLHYQLKEILEQDDPDDPIPVRAASLFYRSCMNIERLEVDAMSQLIRVLSRLGDWPMASEHWKEEGFDWAYTASESIRRWSVMSLFHVYVGLDKMNSSRRAIYIDQPTSVLPHNMLLEPQFYQIQLEAYKQWISSSAISVAKYTRQNVNTKFIEKQAYEVLRFEIQLAKLKSTSEMRKNQMRMYNNMTVRELQEWTDSAIPSLKVINWLRILGNIFNDTDITIDYKDRIIVKEVDFLFRLVQLLNETPLQVLANYMQWRLVKTVSRDVTNEMRMYVTEFEQVFSGIMTDEPRWKECIISVTSVFGFAVGYKYVQKHFDENSKVMAAEMVDNIVSVFAEQLHESEWMDNKTKMAAFEKLHEMERCIGYPEWYANETALTIFYDGVMVGPNYFENVEFMRTYLYKQSLIKLHAKTDRNEWVTGPAVVNAFNNGFVNSIILPAGVLQLPFFDPKRPKALNYGSIGAVIGHEILHGFDDTGRLFDKYGNLVQWWSEETMQMYEKKAECFIKQYNKYTVPLAQQLNTSVVMVNGVVTQSENIADNSGLRQSHLAYQKYVNKHGTEVGLPGLEYYTNEQLFFISYATAWCESNTKESLLQEILTDHHSPHKIRVIGTLSNLQEFSSAFNCPKNSPMNPSTKCVIW